MKNIAIIGFGFSGLMTFFHLTKNPTKNKILVFDKNGQEALGSAFSSFSKHYLLNVPVMKMSAFSNDEKHFYNFLEKNYPEIAAIDEFAPRFTYGQYLQEIKKLALENAQKNFIEFEFIAEEISKITKLTETNFSLDSKNGNSYQASEVVLANSIEQNDILSNFSSKKIINNLWSKENITFHQEKFLEKNICLIGTGLTAVDILVKLKKENFTGQIFAISRRGNFPKAHFTSPVIVNKAIEVEDAKKGILFLCLKIRNFLRNNPQYDLRAVIDSLRPITVSLWHNLDQKNRKLFLRLMPYWNIFRHRAPVESLEIIDSMKLSGQLKILKGSIKKVENLGDTLVVHLPSTSVNTNCIVNCLGFKLNAKKYPLLKQMLEENLLKENLLMCETLNPQIHLLGALNIGKDFECTAVPDLRKQVENLIPAIANFNINS